MARRLAEAGFRAWLVGGAVRDLARGAVPAELDMVSAATPEEVEQLFPRTVGVGRAFGIVRVLLDGPTGDPVGDPGDDDWVREVELATFRSEEGYSDARRPDAVHYSSSVEVDAARRDFTVNALFLDPLTDELLDPTGGLEDLEAGILRTVGDAPSRFREDGLRLLRMARFQAALGLELAPGLMDAARVAADALRGVSPERVLQELERTFEGPGSPGALATLQATGVLTRVLPGWGRADRAPFERRLAAARALPQPPGALCGLALLLEADPLGPGGEEALVTDLDRARALRCSRARLTALGRVWRLRRELPDLARREVLPSRRTRALREPHWEEAFSLALAWSGAGAAGAPPEDLLELRTWRRTRTEEELSPEPLVSSSDLADLGVARGPRWGELLEEAETLQLDGELATREQARAWLAGRARARLPGDGPDQEGGKTRRSPKERG